MPFHILGQDSYDGINIIGQKNKISIIKVKDTHNNIFLKTLSKICSTSLMVNS